MREGFTGDIFCTPATLDLVKVRDVFPCAPAVHRGGGAPLAEFDVTGDMTAPRGTGVAWNAPRGCESGIPHTRQPAPGV